MPERWRTASYTTLTDVTMDLQGNDALVARIINKRWRAATREALAQSCPSVPEDIRDDFVELFLKHRERSKNDVSLAVVNTLRDLQRIDMHRSMQIHLQTLNAASAEIAYTLKDR